MRLATIRGTDGPHLAVFAGRGDQARWVSVSEGARAFLADGRCPDALAGLLRREGADLGTARRIVEALVDDPPPGDVPSWAHHEARFAPPVPEPGAFLDFYAFEQHVRASRARRGLEMPEEWFRHPVYYRSNQRSFLGDRDEACFPPGETMMDYELELAVVVGEAMYTPTARQAEGGIAGYCLLNDWSARAIQREVMTVGLGPCKGKDFATSLGPWLVTPDEVGDLESVELSARVNGEEWSRGSPGRMHWSWGEMLAFAADGARLEPGDVVGSGTLPGGCGLELGKFLEVGDVVELDGGERFGVLAGTVRRREGTR
jgi:fumarylacetoacetate (FAA) hydrolase